MTAMLPVTLQGYLEGFPKLRLPLNWGEADLGLPVNQGGVGVLELNIGEPAGGTCRHRLALSHTHTYTHTHTHNPWWSGELVSGGLTKCFLHMLFCQAAQLLGLQR